MDYEKASDFDVNKAVAEALGLQIWPIQSASTKITPYSVVVDLWSSAKDSSMPVEKNYCHNPSDAWPIIQSSHIDIEWGKDWAACSVEMDHTWAITEYHENPLRAAMIVFLKMQE